MEDEGGSGKGSRIGVLIGEDGWGGVWKGCIILPTYSEVPKTLLSFLILSLSSLFRFHSALPVIFLAVHGTRSGNEMNRGKEVTAYRIEVID